jgi:ATP-binding protein involved in chromosome partitioning
MIRSEQQSAILQAAREFVEPAAALSLLSVGAELHYLDGKLDVQLPYPLGAAAADLQSGLTAALKQFGVGEVQIHTRVQSSAAQQNVKPIQGIKNILVVASGKGGVGKSTTAANLALALAHDGAQVGLLDADIYGPSQARMMGLGGQRPQSSDGKTFAPLVAYNVKVMSIGLLVDDEQPMVWRGPMVSQALSQLLNDCRWGDLDYLVVDMPPGTGDIQLTLSQRVPVSGAVIVTTPQDIALLDARKGLKMFEKVGVPVLGIIENMSTHVCSNCGHEEHVFGAGGGARMAAQYGVDLVAELPLDIRIREQSDEGKPTVVAEPDSKLAQAYLSMARRTTARLARHATQTAKPMPTITVEDN